MLVLGREFPQQICELTNLEVLTLDKNGVKCLPNSISALQNLQTLVLDSNELVCKSHVYFISAFFCLVLFPRTGC